MNTEVFAARRENLRRILRREGLNAILVSHAANRFYLSGFELHDGMCSESSGYLIVIADGNDWLCTDSRYEEAAAQLWERERVFIYTGVPALDIGNLLSGLRLGKIGFEGNLLPWQFVQRIQDGLDLKSADGLVEELRVIKDEAELSALAASAKLNHDMMALLPTVLTVGHTEAEIAWGLEKYFRDAGASGLSFASIVAKDWHAALPHYHPEGLSHTLTPNCHVLVDAGARLDFYCSDQTRTFWVGDRPEDRFLKTLDLVREAQKAAMAIIRPGVLGCEVHAAAVKVFADQGLAAHFTHSLGHGVGLEVHEEPRLNSRSQTVLQPGMIITVEPGLYFPDWGGVRWEYMVAVTHDGCRIL